MKSYKFSKHLVESTLPPKNTNVLWTDVNEQTLKVETIKEYKDNSWQTILSANKTNDNTTVVFNNDEAKVFSNVNIVSLDLADAEVTTDIVDFGNYINTLTIYTWKMNIPTPNAETSKLFQFLKIDEKWNQITGNNDVSAPTASNCIILTNGGISEYYFTYPKLDFSDSYEFYEDAFKISLSEYTDGQHYIISAFESVMGRDTFVFTNSQKIVVIKMHQEAK